MSDGHIQRSRRRAAMRRMVIGASAAVLPGVAGHAQPTPPPDATGGQIEDIVVTAQRRGEAIQSVPVTINAFDAAALQRLGLVSSEDIGQYVANVAIALPSGKGNQPDISIRGVGLNDYNSNNAGPNGVYLDEIYLSAPASQTFQTFDLERVEVLKGPQGTLYGRNSTGGAINYISAKPTDDFHASAEASYASYNTYQVQGMVSGPIAPGVTGRLAFVHNASDGYFTNDTNGKTTNDANDYAYRGSLSIRPSQDVTISASFHGGVVNRRPDEYRQLGTLQGAFGAPCANAQVLAGQCVDALGYKAPGGYYDGHYNRDQSLRVRAEGGFARVDWTPADVTFTSLTGLEFSNRFQPEDTDAEPNHLLELDYGAHSTEITQEFRATGGGGGWNWVGGIYFLHEKLLDTQRAAVFTGLDALLGAGAGDGAAELRSVSDTQSTASYAVFGQTDYALTDSVKATLGVRYTYETKTFDARGFSAVQGVGAASGTFPAPAEQYHFIPSISNDAVSGRAALSWKPIDTTLLYASVSNGFKAGGFNGGLLNNDPVQAFQQLQPIKPERITAFEIGGKSDLLDRRLRIDTALFYYDYHDLQIFNVVPAADNGGVPLNVLTNARTAKIAGGEAEIVARPLDALTLGVNLGYLYTELGTFVSGAGTAAPVSYTGKRFPLSPRFSATGSAEYRIELANQDVLRLSGQASFRTKQYFDSSNDPLTEQGRYWLLDLRGAYETADGHWVVSVFARNVTGTKYLNYALDLSSDFGLIQQVAGLPRFVGGDVKYTF